MRELVFHVGMPKSGTTHLQTMLSVNAAALRARRFHYPSLGARSSHHHAFFNAIREGGAGGVGKALHAAITEGADGATTILSTENFNWNARADQIEAAQTWLSAHFDRVTVVLYIRNFFAFLNARYCERVQAFEHQSGDPPEVLLTPEFVAHARYSRTLKLWQDRFGADAVRAVFYRRDALYRQDIFQDFMHRLDPSFEGGGMTSVPDANPTLSLAALALKRQMNRLMRCEKRALHAGLRDATRAAAAGFSPGPARSHITPEVATIIAGVAGQDEAVLAGLATPALAASVYERPGESFFLDPATARACRAWVDGMLTVRQVAGR